MHETVKFSLSSCSFNHSAFLLELQKIIVCLRDKCSYKSNKVAVWDSIKVGLSEQKLKEFIPKDKKIQIVDVSTVNNIPSSIKSIPTLVINNKEKV